MITKLKQLGVASRGRYLVIATLLALGIASFTSFAAPQRAHAAYAPSVWDCYRYKPLLYKGVQHQNGCVAALQYFYKNAADTDKPPYGKPYYSDMVVDGIFGNVTKYITHIFQQRNGLVDDGIVGPNTWGVINHQCLQPGNWWTCSRTDIPYPS